MTALTPTTVTEITGRTELLYGTTNRSCRLVLVEATTTATSDTTDLSTYVDDISGIIGVVADSLDGADATTSPTWSGTTVTWAGHAGSGVQKTLFLVY